MRTAYVIVAIATAACSGSEFETGTIHAGGAAGAEVGGDGAGAAASGSGGRSTASTAHGGAGASTSSNSSSAGPGGSGQGGTGGAGGAEGGAGGAEPCGPATCAGCCEAGRCVIGTNDLECGEGGAECIACTNTCGWDPLPNDPSGFCSFGGVAWFSCQAHVCAPKNQGGYTGECCQMGQKCDAPTATCVPL